MTTEAATESDTAMGQGMPRAVGAPWSEDKAQLGPSLEPAESTGLPTPSLGRSSKL